MRDLYGQRPGRLRRDAVLPDLRARRRSSRPRRSPTQLRNDGVADHRRRGQDLHRQSHGRRSAPTSSRSGPRRIFFGRPPTSPPSTARTTTRSPTTNSPTRHRAHLHAERQYRRQRGQQLRDLQQSGAGRLFRGSRRRDLLRQRAGRRLPATPSGDIYHVFPDLGGGQFTIPLRLYAHGRRQHGHGERLDLHRRPDRRADPHRRRPAR